MRNFFDLLKKEWCSSFFFFLVKNGIVGVKGAL